MLTGYQVKDPEVWLVQTYAILDDREMVEIRHDLNQRRQKLREKIQYNTETKERYLQDIGEVVTANPSLKKYLTEDLKADIILDAV
jgi:hypothetical protein